MSPKLTSVTFTPRHTNPVTSSRVYVQTPPRVSAVTKMCIFQFLKRGWFLLLDVAIPLFRKRGSVIVVRPLPRQIVRWCGKRLLVQRTPRERKHGDRFADPYSPAS